MRRKRGRGQCGKIRIIALQVQNEKLPLWDNKRRSRILFEITKMINGETENNVLNILHD